MPKRSRKDEDSDEYFRRKLRKLEKELQRRRRSPVISSDSSSPDSSPLQLLQEDDNEQPLSELPEQASTEVENGAAPPPSATIGAESKESLDGTPSVEQPASEKPALDEEILSLLGETPSKDKKYGAEIQNDLAVRWEHIATSGLSKEARKELLEKHIVPNNCKKVEAPALNSEIKAALTEALLKKDKALETKQKQQAAAISCLSEALTLILASEHRDPKILKLLIEAGRIMCDSQHTESLTRRSFICSTIKKELKDQLYDTEIDKFLFGEKLADTLKAAKAINKSATDMKVTAPKSSQNQKKAAPKNSKFPQYNRLQSVVSAAATNPPPATAPATQAPRRPLRPPPPPPRWSRPRAPAPAPRR